MSNYMSELDEIFCDFYCMFNIPICFLDNNMKIVYKVGDNEDTSKILESTTVFKDLRPNLLSSIVMTYFENIHFIVIPTLKLYSRDGYLLIGPFKSKSICKELDLPLKPLSCTRYVCYIIYDMFSKKYKTKNCYSDYVKRALKYIDTYYDVDLKIDEVCKYLSINKSYFCSLFKKETGYTFTGYLNKLRIDKSKDLLSGSDLSVLDVALRVGFNNHNYFTTTFKRYVGCNPLEYRKSTFK